MFSEGFLFRLRCAGIEPDDDVDTQLSKQLLMLATGLASAATSAWLALYWWLGPQFSATWPYLFQLALAANVLIYIARRDFAYFRISQLLLFLFTPFAIQWSIGGFYDASGIVLWGLLAPIGAILYLGVRESLPWFFAWGFLVALSAVFDYLLAESALVTSRVPPRTSVVFFALNFLAVGGMVYFLLRHAISEKRRIQRQLEETLGQLREEERRAERLLLNVLPEPISHRLKEKPAEIIADRIEEASVLFADVVDFTRLASHLSPREVFDLLNQIFTAFDELAERHGVERIKTIGDGYMAASGLYGDQDGHVRAVAKLALEMQRILAKDFSVYTPPLSIKIGIATGPVLAGIIGKKKFIYDLWGDTVNVASRLCTEGMANVIFCNETTWQRLQGQMRFGPPRQLFLKGIGEVRAYPLLAQAD